MSLSARNIRPRLAAAGIDGLEGELFGRNIVSNTGFFCGPWWIKRQPPGTGLHSWRAMQAIGVSTFPGPLQMVFASVFQTGSQSLYADAVVAKTQMRAFYLARGQTLKIAGDEVGRMRNEIAVRRSIVETGMVKVPPVHRSSTDDRPFILEQLVRGGLPPRESDLADGLIGNLWEFYAANGLTAQPLNAIIDPDALDASLGPALNSVAARQDGMLQAWEKLKRDVPWHSAVPVGLCHGDFSATNILMAKGAVFLLDWEHGHRGLILEDFAKLSVRFPSVAELLRPSYARWLGGNEAVSLLSQLFAVCLLKLFAASWPVVREGDARQLMHRWARARTALIRSEHLS